MGYKIILKNSIETNASFLTAVEQMISKTLLGASLYLSGVLFNE